MDWTIQVFSEISRLPRGKGGVYLLFTGDLLDYVGQSEDVHRRLSSSHHVFDAGVHNLIAFIEEANFDTRLALERYFNAKYNPPNSFTGTGKQSTQTAEWHKANAAERRKVWKGPKFDEFSLEAARKNEGVFELSQLQDTDNALGVPSIIAFKPKDIPK